MNRRSTATNSTAASRDELDRYIRTWAIWYRLRRAGKWAVRGLIFGLACWSGFAIAALYYGLLIQVEFINLALAWTAGIVLSASALALFLPVAGLQVTREFDRFFGLQERTSTALEVQASPNSTPIPAAPAGSAMLQQQRTDALQAARDVKPAFRFFFHISRMQVLLLSVLFLANLSIFVLGQGWFARAASQRALQQEIDQQVEAITNIQAQIDSNPELSPERREQIRQALEQARQNLESAQTREEAIAILSSTESQLQSLDDPSIREQANALEQAGDQLQQSIEPGQPNPLESFAENLAQGDFITAASELDALDLADLSSEETEALADQLEQMSEALAGTNPTLAEQLKQAAEAMEQGDSQAAQEALQAAAQELAAAGQQTADAQAAQQAAEQVAQSGQGLAQGAQSLQGNQGAPSGLPADGQQAGAGAGTGESTGSSDTGTEAGDTPIAGDNDPDGAGERPYEQIFSPTRLGPGEGDTVTLPPSNMPGDQVTSTGPTDPGQVNSSGVPYESVYTDYAQAYWLAIESGQVPPAMRELVRKYFSSLDSTSP